MNRTSHDSQRDESSVRQSQSIMLVPVSGYSRWVSVSYVAVVLLFMATAAALYWPMPELGFRSDNSPVSWLSSAQLWALAVIAGRLLLERALPFPLGLFLVLAMVAMAFDEQFMFHEQWKYGCSDWFELCRYSWARDAPMAMVGIGGVAATVWLHRTISPGLGRLQLWAGIGLGLLALSMDLFGLLRAMAAYEEALEVLAEACFLSCLLGLHPRSPLQ